MIDEVFIRGFIVGAIIVNLAWLAWSLNEIRLEHKSWLAIRAPPKEEES